MNIATSVSSGKRIGDVDVADNGWLCSNIRYICKALNADVLIANANLVGSEVVKHIHEMIARKVGIECNAQ